MTRITCCTFAAAILTAAGCGQVAVDRTGQEVQEAVERLDPAIASADLKRDAAFLASDECAGRLTGTPGAWRAAQYISAALARAGLEPGGTDGYYQPFEFTAGVKMLEGQNALMLLEPAGPAAGVPCQLGVDFDPHTFSGNGTVGGEVVFAGYGLVEPASAGQGYDSYAGLDVKDKIVLALRDLPEDITPQRRQELALYAGDRYKAKLAADRGAKAFLLVIGPNSTNAGGLIRFRGEDRTSSVPIPAVSISGELGDRLLAGAGVNLKQLQDLLDGGKVNPHALVSPGARVALSVELERIQNTCRNVIGRLPPVGDGDEYVLVGAHYDHIGTGEGLGSLAKEGERGQIHNGADDNASGAALVLELAAALADARRDVEPSGGMGLRSRPVEGTSGGIGLQSRPVKGTSPTGPPAADPCHPASAGQSHQPQRGVIFALWSGEELGLVGSTHFAAQPPVPLDKVVAYFNFDMVGRLRDNKLVLQGVGSSPAWRRLIERRNVAAGFSLVLQDDPYLPSDATAFYPRNIPVLSFFTDLHEDYNRPTDDAETLNYVGMERVALFARRLIDDVVKPDLAIAYARVERSAPSPDRVGRRVYTGTVPDFAATGVVGAKLSDVRSGGPADQAGLKAGDVIVEFAGKQINNLMDYSEALMGAKVGQPVEIVVEREGQRLTLTITPTARAE